MLLNFAGTVFAKPSHTNQNNSLSSVIKKRANDYLTNPIRESSSLHRQHHHRTSADDQLSRTITSKINDGNISAALRLLLSDDTVAEKNEETFIKLQERHPSAAADRRSTSEPTQSADSYLQVTNQEVQAAIKRFPAGSAGGPDGLRPQHISDLISCRDSGPSLLANITKLVNLLLKGHCATTVIPILFGANLTALTKKSGGIRPIAVGYYWRRLSAKCANTFASAKLATYFSPTQLGVGVPGGCEAAVHACRRFVTSMPDDYVVVKLDFSNAFNCLRRDAMLESIKTSIPEIYSFCQLAYNSDTVLKFGNRQILSQEGIQQGDPLGPLLFCLSIHPLLLEFSSPFTIGFMDDITIGGPAPLVDNDVSLIRTKGKALGLHLNVDKCEQISKQPTPSTAEAIAQFAHFMPDNSTLLGAPLTQGAAMDTALAKKAEQLLRASERLKLISAHDALVLLRASCSSPKLMHLMRSSPCAGHASLTVIDNCLHSTLSAITNVNITDDQWKQASLPIKHGGLGVRSIPPLAPSAFLASTSSTRHLQTQLLNRCTWDLPDLHFDSVLADWCTQHHPVLPPTGALAAKQRSWDKPSVDATFASLFAAQTDDYHRARLIAASAPHSGDWLNALPLSSCGLRLEDDAIRIAVGLRLGANLCEPHECICGTKVTARGNHGLSCRRSSGRTLRHNYINDIVYHALVKAGLPSSKEPSGLSRSDGKRPDGITNVPWQGGKTAVWDVTVSDTLADSYLSSTSVTAAAAAESAASRKETKYATLSTTRIFIPIALESLGPIGSKATSFLKELGRRLSVSTDNPMETAYLFQRVSVAVQRFNAVCVLGCFSSQQDDT
jgi:hypothetical protein